MAKDDHVLIRLELEPRAEPIRGVISADGVLAREFVGWLGLADALERIIALPGDDRRGTAEPDAP